ncbi:GTP 3',8-cyclase MoaA [Aureivirga sp. CE67]|uniref:GTP 3',8-cyclase MoaA n=1 Tax=Aureivirga sp. CE67 TaxID=1788983 RepID=UPI0018CAA2B1|nr:GTP 3',8-cyclase MoaA [Aureivirga sp. CE67]
MEKLIDKYGRQITYLRLAVTDRCNLRCQYCMPAEGIKIVPRNELLSYKEIYRITRALTELGVDKIRLTGGEPFVRKDFMQLLEMLSYNDLLNKINITTNGALVKRHISELEKMKINTINLSIDSLKPERFFEITRRNNFNDVWEALELLEKSSINLKLNIVVQPGVNTDEIVDFVALSKDRNLSVRFIEEMPFNGTGKRSMEEIWDYRRILKEIRKGFPEFETLTNEKSSTSKNFKLYDSVGNFGIIPAYTRTICHDCNRVRITATGMIKNCLFDDGVFNLKEALKKDISNEELKALFLKIIPQKPKNGFVAEENRKRNPNVSESMSTIGG